MWNSVKLREICEFKKGKKVKVIKTKSIRVVPYLLIDTLRGEQPNFYTEDNNYTEAKESDVLVVCDGANSGLIGTGLRGAVGSTIARLRLDEKKINKYYFCYFLKLNFSNLNADVRGAAIPHLKLEKMMNLEIPGVSLKSQNLVVEEIETQFARLDTAIKSLETINVKLDFYRQTVLLDAFKMKNYKETKRIAELCDVVRGGSPRPAGDVRYYGGDIPFLKVADLTRNREKYLSSFEYTIKEAGLKKTRKISPNTLLLTNSGATLGVPKISKIEATMNDGIAAFLNLDTRSIDYLYYFLLSRTKRLRNINQGAAQPNLNTAIIKNLIVPYCNFEKQRKIASKIESRFSIIDKIEETVNIALVKAKKLRTSILKAAFEGKLVN